MKASRQDTNPSAVLVAPHSSLSTKLKEHPRLLSVYVSMQLWSWEEFSDPAIPNLPVPISVNKARQHCYTQHWKEEWSWYCTMPILTDNINLHRDQITGGGGPSWTRHGLHCQCNFTVFNNLLKMCMLLVYRSGSTQKKFKNIWSLRMICN